MKKLISILLAVLMLASTVAVGVSAYSVTEVDVFTADQAIEEHELLYGEEVETKKFYFLMPNGKNGELGDDETIPESFGKFAPTWYNKDASTAGIYWWNTGVADPLAWAGYLPSGVDENDPNIYYANVPTAATTIIWNNGVDGGMDSTLDIYYSAAQSVNIGAEYYDAGESDNYPDGTETFDGMIYVIDPDLVSINELSLKQTCGGEWYYYYGNGCYGFNPDGAQDVDCLRDDHHDADGNHVVTEQEKPTFPVDEPTEATEPEQPTEATEPEQPTEVEPTERPTEPPTTVDTMTIYFENNWMWPEVYAYYWGGANGENAPEPGEVVTEIVGKNGDGVYDIYKIEVPADIEGIIFSGQGGFGRDTSAPVTDPKAGYCYYMTYDEATQSKPCESYEYIPAEPEFELGDVDMDGHFSIMDATEIQMHIAEIFTLSEKALELADYDGSGEVTVLDATAIQRKLARLD